MYISVKFRYSEEATKNWKNLPGENIWKDPFPDCGISFQTKEDLKTHIQKDHKPVFEKTPVQIVV